MSEATGDISDGYHTFTELYAHRVALFLALCRACGCGWKSRLHADGSMFPGWFVAGLALPTGEITYHLPEDQWDNAAHLHTVPRAPAWDGHTATDVVERLTLFAYLGEIA